MFQRTEWVPCNTASLLSVRFHRVRCSWLSPARPQITGAAALTQSVTRETWGRVSGRQLGGQGGPWRRPGCVLHSITAMGPGTMPTHSLPSPRSKATASPEGGRGQTQKSTTPDGSPDQSLRLNRFDCTHFHGNGLPTPLPKEGLPWLTPGAPRVSLSVFQKWFTLLYSWSRWSFGSSLYIKTKCNQTKFKLQN